MPGDQPKSDELVDIGIYQGIVKHFKPLPEGHGYTGLRNFVDTQGQQTHTILSPEFQYVRTANLAPNWSFTSVRIPHSVTLEMTVGTARPVYFEHMIQGPTGVFVLLEGNYHSSEDNRGIVTRAYTLDSGGKTHVYETWDGGKGHQLLKDEPVPDGLWHRVANQLK